MVTAVPNILDFSQDNIIPWLFPDHNCFLPIPGLSGKWEEPCSIFKKIVNSC